ncbi:hypothetical protein CTI12_AA357160 [Artemisia annua]|uniref:Uncharacterized protein n=1 Tax=Artemisia annua TaxID=35608 RepID=A0A2U1MPB2_ARTAN|nr:hypothetical protein CTI12_AA357160 [Artemisia annua]
MGMKGHPQSNCGAGGGGSGGVWMKKKKIAMVVVVILVGVMGVMVVQKVRDRRLFNLVIKDKDRQILTLNLLLQKERQYVKENKRKNQDLNAKLFSLRTQKTELTNKIMEMRSTIGSMKDEQRALELTIDEKQNEIKHKESEIKDLKSSLQTPPKVWSVSSDDPSNREVNLTNKATTTRVRSWFGLSSNGQKPNQEKFVEGHKEVINPNIKVQKPVDEEQRGSGKLASSKEHETRDLTVGSDDAKIVSGNTTDSRLTTKDTGGLKETGNSLSIKGRSFIGAIETRTDGQINKSQLEAKREVGSTEVTQFKSRNYSNDEVHRATNKTKSEAESTDEDEPEIEADTNTSTESRNGSEADQDYTDD